MRRSQIVRLSVVVCGLGVALLGVSTRACSSRIDTFEEFTARYGTPQYTAADVFVVADDPPSDAVLKWCTLVLVDPVEYRADQPLGTSRVVLLFEDNKIKRDVDKLIAELRQRGWSPAYPLGRPVLVRFAHVDHSGALLSHKLCRCSWIDVEAGQ